MKHTIILNEIKSINLQIPCIEKNKFTRPRFKSVNYDETVKKLTETEIKNTRKHYINCCS